MKIKTNELTGAALDWAVAKCKPNGAGTYWQSEEFLSSYHPSNDWAQAGPIIEREKISLEEFQGRWNATWYSPKTSLRPGTTEFGNTPLEAAMRCYVASKLGNEVEVPDELTP